MKTVRGCVGLVIRGCLLACIGCISSGKLVDREMAKIGYRRATRAELLAPLQPSFQTRPMVTPISVQPRERLVGKWSGSYPVETATHLLSMGYRGGAKVKVVDESFSFLNDGTCSGRSNVEGKDAAWSGTWKYTQEGVLTISGKYDDGRKYFKITKLVWLGETQFWARTVDANRYAEVLRKLGKFKSVTCDVDACGVFRTQKILSTRSGESVTASAEGPQICDRIGDVPPTEANAAQTQAAQSGAVPEAPKIHVFDQAVEGPPVATIPVSGKEMEGEWEVVQSVLSFSTASGLKKPIEHNQVTRSEYAFYDDGAYRLTSWINGKESGRNGDWCCTNGFLRLSVDNQKGGKLVMDLKCVKKSEEGLEFRYDDIRAFEKMFLVGNVTSMKALYNEKGELVTHMEIDSEGKNGIKSHIEMDSTYSPMIFERKGTGK